MFENGPEKCPYLRELNSHGFNVQFLIHKITIILFERLDGIDISNNKRRNQ
jgi:hypothetical protein